MKKTNLLSIQKFFYIIYVFVMLFGLTVVCDTNFSSEKSEAAPSGDGDWSAIGSLNWLFTGGWGTSAAGTSDDPYIIDSAADLASLAVWVNNPSISDISPTGKYFAQTANIDLSSYYWLPIGGGNGDFPSNYFQGWYFGNGYTISGLYINNPNDNCVGLFGAIKNAQIIGVQIKSGTVNGKGDVGGVVGYSQGEDGSFSGSSNIVCCSNGATINGVDRVGGIVGGYQHKGTTGLSILDCYNTGSINGKCMVGGILGGQNNNGMHAEVKHCYNTGTIKGTGGGVYSAALAGGIVGRLAGVNGSNGSSSGYVIDCWSTGTMVTGPQYIGGIAGELFYPYTDMVDKGSNYFCTVGKNWGDGHNENAYWVTYVEASTLASNAKKSTWYTNANNWEDTWDMKHTWEIKSGRYPTIKIGYMTLDGDGGTFSSKSGFTISGDTATAQTVFLGLAGAPPTITKTGYTFKEWRLDNFNEYVPTSPEPWFDADYDNIGALRLRFLLAPNSHVTAQWTANKYTVSYNLNGSDSSYGTYYPTSWTYNTAQQISNPTRTGYTFDGWTASGLSTSTAVYGTSSNTTTRWSNANTKVKASSATGALYFKNLRSTSGTVTLTANWTPIEYTLTYNPNGGSVSPPSKKVFYNSAYGDLPTPTKKGYSFTGWYTSPTGGSKVSSTTKMGTADTTIYAHWTVNTYTVKFNDQGGTTNFADMVLIDSTYKTNGTYTFTRNGVTVTYDVSDSALTLNGKPTNDINLFINLGLSFTQNDVYKVSYQKISGSMSGNTTGCFVLEVCDASWALLETRNRVDFHMNNSSGSANLTISSSGATNGAGLKLWFWCNENATPSRVFNNFKVKFKIEKSGTQNVQKQTRFTYGSALEAVAPPTRVGYNFQGYYTQTGGGGTRYFDSSGHPVVSTMNIANNTTTLHAYWTIKTDCTIYYDSSAAGNFDNWTKYTYGDRIDSSYDESSQTNTINITGGGGWETMAIPIYFPTTGVRYTITFNYSGTFKYLSGYNGLRMQLLTSQPAAGNNQNIQAAYANLTSHSAGTTASATISITPSQNIYYLTLNLGYLKDDDPYTLTFNNFNFTSTSGEAARVYQSGHTFNQAVTNLLVPADRGSIFTGWVTESGKAFNSGSTMNAEEIYLNAQWADTWGNHYSSALTQDTSDDYWMISSSKDLARLIYLFNYTTRIDVLKMKFKLTNHIDMSDHYWLPLGTEDRVFSALIDGRGYTIKGLRTISQSLRKDNGGDNSGFIGVSGSYTEQSSTGVTTTYKATIKNIYFEGISINGRNYVAGVVGSVLGDTTISAIAVVGKIYGTNIRGGIAAYAPSTSLATISDCLVDVSPSNIVIRNNYITATNSVNYSTGKLAKTSGTFTNWIENLTGMKYTMLPKGLTWIASGG